MSLKSFIENRAPLPDKVGSILSGSGEFSSNIFLLSEQFDRPFEISLPKNVKNRGVHFEPLKQGFDLGGQAGMKHGPKIWEGGVPDY